MENPVSYRRNTKENLAKVMIRDSSHTIRLGLQVTVLSLEHQSHVHYAMPLRVLNGDGSCYDGQWRSIQKIHKKAGNLQGAEFLSGMGREDRLLPSLTLVLYYGMEPWDGPRRLKDLLQLEYCPEELEQRIADYPMQLLEVAFYPHTDKFRTDLRYVFGFLQRSRDRKALQSYVAEHAEVFSHLDWSAYEMLRIMTHSEKLLRKSGEEKGRCDMCKALEDLFQSGVEQGIAEGEARGEARGKTQGEISGIRLAREVIRLQMAGSDENTIAERCEIPVTKVREILL